MILMMDYGEIKIVGGRVVLSPAGGTVWLTKHGIADLFGCFISKVDANVRAILKAGFLDENTVCRRQNYENGGFAEFYNLEMITALAFRIKSQNADSFRRWLTERATHRPLQPVSIVVPWNGLTN